MIFALEIPGQPRRLFWARSANAVIAMLSPAERAASWTIKSVDPRDL